MGNGEQGMGTWNPWKWGLGIENRNKEWQLGMGIEK